MSRGNLIIIAKECIPGRVKTRLTPPLTHEQGATIAHQSLLATLHTMMAVKGVNRILYLDGDETFLLADVPDLHSHFSIIPQPTGGLDERLADIFDAVSSQRTILIGMDTPQVSAAQLDEILEDGTHHTWLGPALDGGYWLIGMDEPSGAPIRGVPMSEDDTAQQQLASLARHGRETHILESLTDIDHWADALTVASLLPGSAFAAAVEAVTPALLAPER